MKKYLLIIMSVLILLMSVSVSAENWYLHKANINQTGYSPNTEPTNISNLFASFNVSTIDGTTAQDSFATFPIGDTLYVYYRHLATHIKLNRSDLSLIDSQSFAGYYLEESPVYDEETNYLYYGADYGGRALGELLRINYSNFSDYDVLNLGGSTSLSLRGLTIKDDVISVNSNTNDTEYYINKTTFTLISEYEHPFTVHNHRQIFYGDMEISLAQLEPTIEFVNVSDPSNPTLISLLNVSDATDFFYTQALISDNYLIKDNYLYAGSYRGNIYKINLDTLTEEAVLATSVGSRIYSLVTDQDKYLFAAPSGYLLKINTTGNMSEDLSLEVSANPLQNIIIGDNFLYYYNLTGSFFQINKTDLSTYSYYEQDYDLSDVSNYGLSFASGTLFAGATELINKLVPQITIEFTAIDATNGSSIEDFNITYLDLSGGQNITSSGTTVNINTTNLEQTYFFSHPDYITKSVTIQNNSDYSYVFSVNPANSLDLYFYNEITKELISENVSVELISDTYAANYTAVNGSAEIRNIPPEDYVIRYQDTDYGILRQYLFTLTEDTYSEIDLYMINSSESTETTVTVYDSTTLNPVEGAIVYLQRYYIDTNSYVTVAQYETDIGGNSYFDIEHDNELYQFRVDFPWKTQKLLTDPLYVSETQLNLYINLLSPIAEELFSDLGITYSLTYDNTTQSFQLSYNDPASTASEYCLNLKTYGTYGIDTINSTCSSSASGSLSVSGFESGKTNYGAFDITTSTGTRNIATIWQELITNTLGNDRFGLFLVIIIYCVLIFMSSSSLMAGLIGTSAFPMAKLLGVINLDWGATFVPVILGLLIISFVASRR